MVQATCGTTVIGAFDPLDAIADVCRKHNIWLHADVSPFTTLLCHLQKTAAVFTHLYFFYECQIAEVWGIHFIVDLSFVTTHVVQNMKWTKKKQLWHSSEFQYTCLQSLHISPTDVVWNIKWTHKNRKHKIWYTFLCSFHILHCLYSGECDIKIDILLWIPGVTL